MKVTCRKRVILLYEAQVAVHATVSIRRSRRCEAITLAGAKHPGRSTIASVRSKPGKDADLVLYDGDPFEYTTHVCRVLVEGETVSDVCR